MNISLHSRLALVVLALFSLTITSCDDDDEILGRDLTDNNTLFLSSNTSGQVGVIDFNDDPLTLTTFTAGGTDSDGIYYDDGDEIIIQVNRSNSTLVAYDDVMDAIGDSEAPNIAFSSTSNFENGRGLTNVDDDLFIVAQDADDDNALVFYEFDEDDGFTFQRTLNVDFNLWGIRFVDGKLYAIEDNSNRLAIFDEDDLNAADGSTITPERFITIEGMVRTHGLIFDEDNDIMVLTDVGEASSDSDGALFIIRSFSDLANNATITASDYTRIAGPATFLGNPVDVALGDDDDPANRIYVAERANGGGQLLIFDIEVPGNIAPNQRIPFPGASSLFFND